MEAEDTVSKDEKEKTGPKAGGGRGEALSKRALLAAELAAEIQGLRPVLKDMLEIYRSRVDGQLAGLCEVLAGLDGSGSPLPPAKIEARMLEAVRALKIKARKGRAKDLARIEELANVLWAMMPQDN